MAKQIITEVTCDFVHRTSVPATNTFVFGFEGSQYEIDTCEDHAIEVKDFVGTLQTVGRRITDKPVRKSTRGVRSASRAATTAASPSGEKAVRAEMREWARANGFDVGERGRISEAIQEGFAAAQRGFAATAEAPKGGRRKKS